MSGSELPPVGHSSSRVEAVARALQAHWEKDADGEGYEPRSWDEIEAEESGSQEAWRGWARVALDAAAGSL